MLVNFIFPPAIPAGVYLCLARPLLLTVLGLLSGCSSPSAQNDNANTANHTAKTHDNTTPSSTQTIRIAAAANLADVLPKIIATYQVDNHNAINASPTASTIATPIKIDVTYASSGKLYAQITAGAPYDMLLSANQAYPLKLAKTKLVANGSKPFTYAQGQLAWYSTLHPINPNTFSLPSHTTNSTQTLSTLFASGQKISIANPQLAPYGASAQVYLQQLGLYDKLRQQGRIIQAENIGQAFQYVHSGSVDYGLVAVSQLIATHAKASQYQTLAPNHYPPILQDGIVLNGRAPKNRQAASDFATYLQSPAAQQQFAAAGYLAVSQ